MPRLWRPNAMADGRGEPQGAITMATDQITLDFDIIVAIATRPMHRSPARVHVLAGTAGRGQLLHAAFHTCVTQLDEIC